MLLHSLVLTGALQGLFLILLLRLKTEISKADKLLMLWLGILSLQLLFYYDNLSVNPITPHLLHFVGFALPLLSSALLYLYIYSIAFGHTLPLKRASIHALPYLFFVITYFVIQLVYPDQIHIGYGIPDFSPTLPPAIAHLLTWPLAIVPAYYTVISIQTLWRYQQWLPDNYSYTEKINLQWLKQVVFSLTLLFTILFFVIKYGVPMGWLSPHQLFVIVGSTLSGYVFFIGYFGLRQTTILSNIPAPALIKTPKPSYANTGMNEQQAARLFEQLRHHMEVHKPYLHEDLNLNILARQLDISANQLSQVINQHAQTSFFNFVNGYRIKAMKEKLKDPAHSHYSILAIGYECGFKSKSSMNKIFKDFVRMTPSEYQKSQI